MQFLVGAARVVRDCAGGGVFRADGGVFRRWKRGSVSEKGSKKLT